MKTAARHPARIACNLAGAIAAALAFSAVSAQTAPPRRDTSPPSPAVAPVASGSERSIERIRTEDAGSRIDELRVGGETQQIIVQPKTAVPAYEVKPAAGARGTAPSSGNGDTNGSRVWNFFKF